MNMIFSGLYLLDYRNHTDFVKLLLYFLPNTRKHLINLDQSPENPIKITTNLWWSSKISDVIYFFFSRKCCAKRREALEIYIFIGVLVYIRCLSSYSNTLGKMFGTRGTSQHIHTKGHNFFLNTPIHIIIHC